MNNGLVVRNIIFINRAPFEKLDLKFIDGVNVLSSENGRGKTTIMSYVVDALHEMAKQLFHQSYVGHETAWYRISSGAEIMDGAKPSVVYIRFSYQGENVDYIDYRGELNNDIYNSLNLPDSPIPISTLMSDNPGGNMYKSCRISDRIKSKEDMFYNHIATYFPAYRYEMPAYMNEKFHFDTSHFDRSQRFQGHLPNPIEIVTGVDNISDWLMDVVLDLGVQEHNNKKAPESLIWNNVCNVLEWALLAKKKNNLIRFGLGKRNAGASRVSVLCENSDGSTTRLSPSVSFLSSGEKSLLGIFGEILRQADHNRPNIKLDEIDGLVLVDEIDKHLHIRQQKEALPQLVSKFPNLQFVVSSHSPFLNMGLADEASVPSQIIDLDAGGVSCAPRNNQLYQQVYEMMLNDKANFAKQIAELQKQLEESTSTKVLVVTEGKTDIIHINKAKEKLGITLDYDTIAPEKQPDGESDLLDMLKQIAKAPNEHKIIGIFDCDTKTTKGFAQPYESLGNNVYAFKIQPPQKRIDNGQSEISIEYLYSDEEVKTMLPNNTRIFFGTEFSKRTGLHIENADWILANQSDRGKDKIVENVNGQAVYDKDENNYLAKKSDFANAVANETIEISNESWENFRHIFETIEEIIKL